MTILIRLLVDLILHVRYLTLLNERETIKPSPEREEGFKKEHNYLEDLHDLQSPVILKNTWFQQ